jgi:hypothetical protein
MDTLRIAVVSTPRSGNTWLRHMLSQLLDLAEHGAHRPNEVDWQALPPRAVLQLHWLPVEEFTSLLEEHGFRPVVLARHPLDVLISILAFSQHDESTIRWLGGAAGNERCLEGASPLGEAFLDYATGPRAKALLNVSVAWWQAADVCRVRYEDLVRDPAEQLSGILATLGVVPRRSLSEVVQENSIEQLRSLSVDFLYHVWQAQPGLWKRLLTAPAARRIGDAHQSVLSTFGYACAPDEALSAAEAEQAWERLDAAALKRNVHGIKRVLAEAEANHYRDVAALRAELANVVGHFQRQLEQARESNQAALQAAIQETEARHQGALAEQRTALDALSRQFAALPHDQLRELSGLGEWSIATARTVQRWSHRFPRWSRAFKSLANLWRPAIARREESEQRNR